MQIQTTEMTQAQVTLFQHTKFNAQFHRVLLKYKAVEKNEIVNDFCLESSVHSSWDRDLFYATEGTIAVEIYQDDIMCLQRLLAKYQFEVDLRVKEFHISEYGGYVCDLFTLSFKSRNDQWVVLVEKLSDAKGIMLAVCDTKIKMTKDPMLSQFHGFEIAPIQRQTRKIKENSGDFSIIPPEILLEIFNRLDKHSQVQFGLASQFFNSQYKVALRIRHLAHELNKYVISPNCYDKHTFPHKTPLRQLLGIPGEHPEFADEVFTYYLKNYDVNECNNTYNLTLLNMLLLSGMGHYAKKLMKTGKFKKVNFECFILGTGCIMHGNALDFALFTWPAPVAMVDNELIKLLLQHHPDIPQANKVFVQKTSMGSKLFIDFLLPLIAFKEGKSEQEKMELLQLLHQYGFNVGNITQLLDDRLTHLSTDDFVKNEFNKYFSNVDEMKQYIRNFVAKLEQSVANLPRIVLDETTLHEGVRDNGEQFLNKEEMYYLADNQCVVM